MTQNPTPSSKTQENTILPTGHYCRKNDAEIQRRIDRGIWRPSLDTGHVYSTVKKANLKEAKRSGDYLTVTDHKQIFRVHRIIWIAAHGIPDAEYQIDHINGNKEDNRLQNLQLVTGRDNTARSCCALTFAGCRGDSKTPPRRTLQAKSRRNIWGFANNHPAHCNIPALQNPASA